MRLLAFREERRRRRLAEAQGSSAVGVSSGGKGNINGIGGREGPTKTAGLAALLATADASVKERVAAEKEGERLASLARRGINRAAPLITDPLLENNVTHSPGVPILKLLGRLKRQSLVRQWIRTTARLEKSGRGKVPSSTITRLHAGVLRGVLPKGTGEVGGATVAATAAQSTTFADQKQEEERGVSHRRHRISRLKREILNEKVEMWVGQQSDKKIVAAFYEARASAQGLSEAVSAAEKGARTALRTSALEVLRGREASRYVARINAGKIIPPVVTSVSATTGKVIKITRDREDYARELSEKVVFSSKRIRRVGASLVQRGVCEDPLQAGLRARAAWKMKEESVNGRGVDSSIVVEEGEGRDANYGPTSSSTLAVAQRLGSLPLSLSSDAVSIKRVLRGLSAHSAEPVEKAFHALGGSTVSVDPDIGGGGGGGEFSSNYPKAAPTAPPPPLPLPQASQVQFSSDQAPCPLLDETIREMLSVSLFYQERAAAENPLKARRRLCVGLREAARAAKNGSLKLLCVAPNLDCTGGGILDATVCAVISAAREASPPVPVIFALNRKKMGTALGLKVRASIVAFLSLDDLRGLPARAMHLASEARERRRVGDLAAVNSPACVEASGPVHPPTPLASVLRVDAPEWVPASQQ